MQLAGISDQISNNNILSLTIKYHVCVNYKKIENSSKFIKIYKKKSKRL